MSVDLQPDTLRRIEDRVGAGRYGSADEVVRAGLDLLEQREQQRQQNIEEVRHKIARGVHEFERGDGFDGEQVFEELLASLDEKGERL